MVICTARDVLAINLVELLVYVGEPSKTMLET
jgi:hypothetical protein